VFVKVNNVVQFSLRDCSRDAEMLNNYHLPLPRKRRMPNIRSVAACSRIFPIFRYIDSLAVDDSNEIRGTPYRLRSERGAKGPDSAKRERECLRGMFRALSTRHYRSRYSGEKYKRSSKRTAIPKGAAPACRCVSHRACSHRAGWAGRRSRGCTVGFPAGSPN